MHKDLTHSWAPCQNKISISGRGKPGEARAAWGRSNGKVSNWKHEAEGRRARWGASTAENTQPRESGNWRPMPYRFGSQPWNAAHFQVAPGAADGRREGRVWGNHREGEVRKVSGGDPSTAGFVFKHNHAITESPPSGIWWKATPSLLAWFMRSPESPAQLHPSGEATHYFNIPHLLFFWLTSTSLLKGPEPCWHFWGPTGGRKEERKGEKEAHPPNGLVAKTYVATQDPAFADTRLYSYSDFFGVPWCKSADDLPCSVKLYIEALLFLLLKGKTCCFCSQRPFFHWFWIKGAGQVWDWVPRAAAKNTLMVIYESLSQDRNKKPSR